MEAEVGNEESIMIDEASITAIVHPYQAKLRNSIRKSSNEYKKYRKCIEESLGLIVSLSNRVNEQTYLFSDNWGILAPFSSIHDVVRDGMKIDISKSEELCRNEIVKLESYINSMKTELQTVQFIHESLRTLVNEKILQNWYILDGLSTITVLESTLDNLITNLLLDLEMRSSIVADIRGASLHQMEAYASAWKYGPLLDKEVSHQFISIVSNELV